MAAVMIGVDPHKASHTVVAIDAAEEQLGRFRVRASASQAERLLAWAQAWPERTWAVEGAGGMGHLLAQQLLAAGERVLDVAPKLGARVRLLASGDTNKNDPNDAHSVAVAALRSKSCRPVAADDHAAVLKVWAKRHRDLSRTRTQAAAGCTPCCASWSPVASPGKSPQLMRPICWNRARRQVLSPQPAVSSLPRSLRTCGASTPSCGRPRRSWPWRSPPQAPASPRSSGLAPSSPPPSSAASAPCLASPAGTTSPPTTAPRRSRCPPGRARSTG